MPVPILLLLTAPSPAYVFIGNPNLHVSLGRAEADLLSGSALLERVRVFQCGGGYTDYPVGEWIDPVAGWSTVIEGGDLCGVALRWDSDVTVSSSSFVLRYEQLTTSIWLSADGTGSAPLSPSVVDQGTLAGSTPTFELGLSSL